MRALILFLKNPNSPAVKTRLGAGIGEVAARNIYYNLVDNTLTVARRMTCPVLLFIDGDESHPLWDNERFTVFRQFGSDLGERLSNAFELTFGQGYDQVVVTGSDIPDINATILEAAFEALHDHDFVVGPAQDGGYYLIGMREMNRAVFRHIPWSSSEVLSATLQVIENLGKTAAQLDTLADVDVAEDLNRVGQIDLLSARGGRFPE